MNICLDFDGTCVTHDFPLIGKDIGAIPVLKKLVEKGHNLILFTMRSDIESPTGKGEELHLVGGNYLSDAVNWFIINEIPLWGIQVNPEQSTWTTSPKAYGHIYIDDAAIGCPLLFNPELSERHFVDWVTIGVLLRDKGII